VSFVPKSENYLQMSSQEKQAFNEWLGAILVPSSMLALGLLALAVMGGGNFGSTQTTKVKAEASLASETSLVTSGLPRPPFEVVTDRP
jgi:hypothetical protein